MGACQKPENLITGLVLIPGKGHCQSALVYRHGQNPKGHDRFRCRDYHRVFQLDYSYEARKPGIKEQITEMAFNGAGVRDTARTLKVGIKTVIRTLKNSRHEALLNKSNF